MCEKLLNLFHYVSLIQPNLTIHSDPMRFELDRLQSIVESGFVGIDGINGLLLRIDDRYCYSKARRAFGQYRKTLKMAVLFG